MERAERGGRNNDTKRKGIVVYSSFISTPVRGHSPSHSCPLLDPSTISGTGTQVPRSPGHRDPCLSYACQSLESCRGANNLFRVLVTFSLGARGKSGSCALKTDREGRDRSLEELGRHLHPLIKVLVNGHAKSFKQDKR